MAESLRQQHLRLELATSSAQYRRDRVGDATGQLLVLTDHSRRRTGQPVRQHPGVTWEIRDCIRGTGDVGVAVSPARAGDQQHPRDFARGVARRDAHGRSGTDAVRRWVLVRSHGGPSEGRVDEGEERKEAQRGFPHAWPVG